MNKKSNFSLDINPLIMYHISCTRYKCDKEMREWLSGGVSPCQGEGRGFESRLALNENDWEVLIFQGFPIFLCVYSLYTLVDSLQSLGYEVIGFFFRQWIIDISQGSI